jgi:HAD superfamily hydrolase (TIGR01509 family)
VFIDDTPYTRAESLTPMYFTDKILDAYARSADVVVFDMNGTIVDDEPIQILGVNEVFAAHGVNISKEEFISRCVGQPTRPWMRHFLPAVSDAGIERLIVEREAAYARLVAGKVNTLVRPGVLEFIDWVTAQPKKNLAVATSSTPANVETILGGKGLNIVSSFDFIITGEDVKTPKPDPEIYNRVRAEFPTAKNFLVIEDTWAGVTAAKATDMVCFSIPSEYTRIHDHSAADAVIDNLLPSAQRIKGR